MSKGWIKGYLLLSNAYPRKGEPDLYLILMTDRIATGPEGEKRNDEYSRGARRPMRSCRRSPATASSSARSAARCFCRR
ncbi:MAG: hypothetical protein EOP37_20675 [Rubrivivax sp.]|nr:MAG: hypothetical protein EOP37_20675 [Rubrivivax sp.]